MIPKLAVLAVAIPFFVSCNSNPSPIPDSPKEESRIRNELWKMENPTCVVKGNSANWQAAYCMWLTRNTEFDSSVVKECYETLTSHEGVPKSLCARNKYFKNEICKSLVLSQTFSGSLQECLSSDDSVPRVVREGLDS